MAFYTFLCGALLMTAEAAPPITLDEALEALTANHPIFTKTALTIEQAQLNESALAQEEVWRLSVREENLLQGGDPANPFGPARAIGASAKVGVQRDFWSNGSRLEVGLTSSYLYLQHDDDAGTFALGAPNLPDVAIPLTRDGLESALSVQYTYPLMKNPGLLKRLSLQDAALKVAEEEYQAREVQELAMVSVAGLYVRWWLLNEQEKILLKRVDLAKENRRLVSKRQRARLAERVDVLRSEQALERARSGLAECRWRASGVVAELQTILGITNLVDRAPQAIVPQAPAETEEKVDWVLQTRRLNILNTLRTRLQLQVSAEQERLKPELALVMRAGLKREDFRYTDDGSEGEFNPDAFAGVTFSVPLDRSFVRTGIESVMVGQRIIDEEIRAIRLELTSQKARIDSERQSLNALVKVKDRQLSVASQRAREEGKLFKLGRTLLNFVIQSQDEVQQAKMERLEVIGRLMQLEIERLALMDLFGTP